jgi:hypothetical protein
MYCNGFEGCCMVQNLRQNDDDDAAIYPAMQISELSLPNIKNTKYLITFPPYIPPAGLNGVIHIKYFCKKGL